MGPGTYSVGTMPLHFRHSMMEATTDLTELLQTLRRALEELYGERLHQVILYGSHARGEASEDSDVDVMVVLKGPVDLWQEIDRMNDPAYRVQLAFGKLISLYPVAIERYQSADIPLLRNIRREGIEL